MKQNGQILRNWSDEGVLIAHPLFRQIKMTGASITAAKFRAAWKSPYGNTKYPGGKEGIIIKVPFFSLCYTAILNRHNEKILSAQK